MCLKLAQDLGILDFLNSVEKCQVSFASDANKAACVSESFKSW